MPRAIFIVVIVCTVFLSTGCTKFLEFEGENAQPRLVLNGVFQPDSVFQIALSNSLGFVDIGALRPFTAGRVALRDGNGNFLDSLLHQGNGIYRANITSQQGDIYTIEADGGPLGKVSAISSAPLAIPINRWDTLGIVQSESFFESRLLEFSFEIDDPANQDNFYMLEVFNKRDYFIDYIFDPGSNSWVADTVWLPNPQRWRSFMRTSDQVLLAENNVFVGDIEFYSDALLFSDQLFDGLRRSFTVRVEDYRSINEGDIFEFRLSSMSRALFLYERTVQRYDLVVGDPFAEPVQVFSNIEGGLGIWGGRSFFTVNVGE